MTFMKRKFCAQENAFNYDKGVLAEILEPIMGKGLIPADLETWKPRRRAIVPAFHKAYLQVCGTAASLRRQQILIRPRIGFAKTEK